MLKSVKTKAEEKFSAIQKKGKKVLKEKEKARLERAEHVASLRALRLAKEVADKEAAAEKAAAKKNEARLRALRLAKKAADKKAAEKAAAKNKKSSRLPAAHRR